MNLNERRNNGRKWLVLVRGIGLRIEYIEWVRTILITLVPIWVKRGGIV